MPELSDFAVELVSLGVDAIDHHPYGGAGTVSVTPPARTSKIAPRW